MRAPLVALIVVLAIAGTVATKNFSSSYFGLCNICIPLMEFEGAAIKLIIEGKDPTSCVGLCGGLGAANDSCMAVCGFLGIQQFIGLLTLGEFKPIKTCAAMKICKIDPYAAGNITSLVISPTSADRGQKFSVNFVYSLSTDWPVGELKYSIQELDGNVIQEEHIDYIVGKKVGDYKKSLSFKPKDKKFTANTSYNVVIDMCNTECGIDAVSEATVEFHIQNAN